MLETTSFYLFSSILLFSALLAITLRNPVYCVLSFLVGMFSLAILFLLLKAYFVAIIHITLYAGAILVLFLFVLMLLGYNNESPVFWKNPVRYGLSLGLSILSLAGLFMLVRSFKETTSENIVLVEGTVESLGKLLFSKYLLPFELLSLILLVAIIGSVVLAKKDL